MCVVNIYGLTKSKYIYIYMYFSRYIYTYEPNMHLHVQSCIEVGTPNNNDPIDTSHFKCLMLGA